MDHKLLLLMLFSSTVYANCGYYDGLQLPCYRDYLSEKEGDESLPLYPFAKRPNGCSIPDSKPGVNDSFGYAGIHISFSDICNEHDKCYYTLGNDLYHNFPTSPSMGKKLDLDIAAKKCNAPFHDRLMARCEKEVSSHAFNLSDLLSAGGNRAIILGDCQARALAMSNAVTGFAFEYYRQAQVTQADYLRKVKGFVAEFQKNPISHIDVILGNEKNISCNSANMKKNQTDLNSGAGGKFIYLCEERLPKKNKLVDIKVTVSGDEKDYCPTGYKRDGIDLNSEAKGKYIYFCRKYSSIEKPIRQIKFGVHKDAITAQKQCGNGWVLRREDLNAGANGDFVYICFLK